VIAARWLRAGNEKKLSIPTPEKMDARIQRQLNTDCTDRLECRSFSFLESLAATNPPTAFAGPSGEGRRAREAKARANRFSSRRAPAARAGPSCRADCAPYLLQSNVMVGLVTARLCVDSSGEKWRNR
jgi:hypothetical protein